MPDTEPETPARRDALGIAVRNLRIAWGEDVLLDGLSFDIAPRSWACLLGESGAGKTTLLRTLAGLAEPQESSDIRASDGLPLTGRVAYMAQQDLLLPWLDATQNVALGARLRGETADPDRVRALMERTGIAARAGARPGELSGGERQRVALARTLMEDRPVVLMDEPFSALDAITRGRLQELAHELLCDCTVLMVTHDPYEALRLAHRVHVITRGAAGDWPALEPAGSAPRDPSDPALREAYAAIMARLSPRPSDGERPGAAA